MNREYTAEVAPDATATSADQLSALFDTHYQRLYRLARRLTSSQDDALDLVQETFVRAARNSSSVPASDTEQEAWLVRVLVNLCRDHWRKSHIRDRHAKEAASHRPPCNGRDVEENLVARTVVWQALDALPSRRRAIIVMHELEGIAVAEIARLLEISTVTVRWHLSLGRRELARVLGVHKGGNER